MGLRPEAITDPDSADAKAETVSAQCMIEVVETAGSDTFAITRLGGREATARLRADATVQPGRKTKLVFNLSKAVFFDAHGNRVR